MLAKKYRAKVISISNNIEGVYTLEFKSLNGCFKYLPGQFLHLAIDSEYDGIGQWPDSRCFSMQSNPDEENIKITYSVKGVFTNQMERDLVVGSEVWLKLPYGDLFLRNHSLENTVFIAGGTGVTPFLSLFTHKSFYNYINPLIYLGFRTKSHNIYNKELSNINNQNALVKIFYQDIDGLINLATYFKNCKSSFFISGPPLMIQTFRQSLINFGTDVNCIFTDDWF